MSDIFSVDVRSFGIDWRLIASLFATQMVFALYGAGIRRPFGSLATVAELPEILRQSTMPTVLADLAFVSFLLAMWVGLFMRMPILLFVVLATAFAAIGELLSHRIRLVPSFFISLALVACAIFLMSQGGGEPAIALAAQR